MRAFDGVLNDDYTSENQSLSPEFCLSRESIEISYMARVQSVARVGARKSEISVAACRRGFRSPRSPRLESSRVDLRWRGAGGELSGISLRGSVGPNRLSRTRPATPPRSDDDRNGARSSSRQTGRRRETCRGRRKARHSVKDCGKSERTRPA